MTSISGELEIMITSSLFLYQPNSSPRDVWREDRSLDISVPFFTILLKFFPKICGSIEDKTGDVYHEQVRRVSGE